MSRTGKYVTAIVIVLALAAGFLGFTKPGHQLLNQLGFASACDSGSCS